MMTLQDFRKMKVNGNKISMVTCYDYTSAQIVNGSSIDCILVGDSASMVIHGHDSTIPMTTELMCTHIKSVAKGASQKFVIGDLPFLSYRSDLATNMKNISMIMQAGAKAVKLEGGEEISDLVSHLTQSGIPVMGHLGLTPQSIHKIGGFRVQGRTSDSAHQIVTDAKKLEKAGAFALVLECVPSDLAEHITQQLTIPTIGIGAGVHTDGQVLVFQDLLGLNQNFSPKFLRKFLNGHELILNALNSYSSSVKSESFPNIQESYE